MRTLEPRFAATESLLLAGLLLPSALALRASVAADLPAYTPLSGPLVRLFPFVSLIPDHFLWELLPAVALCIVLYWSLQGLGRGQVAFWLMAALVLLPQVVFVWEHNRIDWLQLFDLELVVEDERYLFVEDERYLFWDTTLFLVSLVGLAALYRAIGLRQLDRRMLLQGIERADRDAAAKVEAVMLAGLVAAALLATLLMLALSALLGRFDGPLHESSWSVVTIGGGATILLALSLALWYRGRRG